MRRLFVSLCLLLAVAAAGEFVWDYRYDGTGHLNDMPAGIVLARGCAYVTGTTGLSASVGAMVSLRIAAESGGLVGIQSYYVGANGASSGNAIATDYAGHILAAGDAMIDGASCFLVVRYDTSFSQEWELADENEEDAGCEAVAARGETTYAAGTWFATENSGLEFRTCRISPASNRDWYKHYNPVSNEDLEVDDIAHAVCVGSDGYVYVTGESPNGDTADNSLDIATIKYNSAGDTQWVRRYNAGVGLVDVPAAIATDASGNVFVVGTSDTTGHGADILTIKYSAAGVKLWTRRYNGTATASDDEGAAVAVDESGNVYVAGKAVNASSSGDMELVKYGSDGTLLWARAFDGTANGDDGAMSVVCDTVNHWVFVAGTATNTGTGRDFVTLKFLSDGSPLDTFAFDGGSGDDVAVGLALDNQGGIYVVGSSASAQNGTDIVVAKFRQRFLFDMGVQSLAGVPTQVDLGDTIFPHATITSTAQFEPGTIDAVAKAGSFYADTVAMDINAGDTTFTIDFAACVLQESGMVAVSCSLLVTDSYPTNDRLVADLHVCGAGWLEKESLPGQPSGKRVKDGGWLAYNSADGYVYAVKGNKVRDFYRYDYAQDSWLQRELVPLGTEGKPPQRGAKGCSDGQRYIYATKGNNTLGFLRYDTQRDSWEQLSGVPLGPKRQKVKGGTDIVFAERNDTGYCYLLKGYRNEFYRYNTASGLWDTLASAPIGTNYKWNKGSWLAYDGSGTIYAQKARYHELWAYDLSTGHWGTTPLRYMPVENQQTGRRKKSGDGGAGVWANGSLFAFKGNGSQDLWQYRPSPDSWYERDTIPRLGSCGKRKFVKAGADMEAVGRKLYAFKGNKCNEFWRYLPAASFRAGSGNALAGSSGKSDRGGSFGEQAITTGAGAETPRWSADGKYCVFSRPDANGWSQIYRRGRLDTVELQITHDSTDHERPVLDAQGKRVCMQVLDTLTGYYQIGKARVIANATVTMLTSDSCDNVMPEWRPVTGSRIVYEKDMDEYSHIYMMDTLGSSQTALTSDNADHYEPSWVNDSIVCYILSPDDDYDQVAKVNVNGATHVQTVLTTAETDHDNVNPAANGQKLSFEVTDAYGVQQVGSIMTAGTSEATLTSGTTDKTEPDWSASGNAIYCANWTGITSEIGWVSPWTGNYTASTDDDAIRDNPDVYYGYSPLTNDVIYEREDYSSKSLHKGDDGDGIYLVSQVEQGQDGQMGAGLRVLALDRAEPNPAAGRVTIHWQLPADAQVSLKVYNSAGQVVNTLVSGRQKAGAYTTIWDGTDVWGRRLAAGVYFYKLESDGKRLSRKVVLAGRE